MKISLNSILAGLLLIVAIFAVAEVGLLVRDIRNSQESLVASVKQTIDDLNATVLIVRGAVVNASMVLGRIEEASQSWQKASDKQAKYWASLQDKSLSTLDGLNTLSASLNEIVRHTDASLNADLLPHTGEAIEQVTATLKSMDTAIVQASGRANASLEAIHLAVSDPSLSGALKEIQGASENIRQTTKQVELASQRLPDIAENIKKISETTNKFAIPISIARIGSLLMSWIPWLF
jgi:methyl-accepting chemotaxis protein